ncbi:MAG: ferredoxin--NADP reductase [Candidatus Marinimicrobia bacterium]|nr:ferredoxin--NADP reductase [Candidatus Neomarinimicrobiota bacterium]
MEKPNAVLQQKIEVAPGLCIFRIAPKGWELPAFRPGQYAVLGLPPDAERVPYASPPFSPAPEGRLIKRTYSIASSSSQKHYLEFYIKMVSTGALTPRLFALKNGDMLWMRKKVFGMFTLDDFPTEKNVIFFATGTGLAPYMSMLRSHLINDTGRKWAVVHGALNSWDLGYRDELITMERFCPEFTYIPMISNPREEPVSWNGYVGFLDKAWKEGYVQKAWNEEADPGNTVIFLCGHPMMVSGMEKLLMKSGFRLHSKRAPGNMVKEKFS